MSGGPSRPTGFYFTLYPAQDGPHGHAGRVALLAYAAAIAATDPALAAELRDRADSARPTPAPKPTPAG
jgi:hypothetical protein